MRGKHEGNKNTCCTDEKILAIKNLQILAGRDAEGCTGLQPVQRLPQVGPQVLHVLDAHRVAHQVLPDADLLAALGGTRGAGRGNAGEKGQACS